MAKVLILIFLALSIRANCTQLIEYCRKPPALFVFGDSFFDPGNNNYIKTTTLDQANFWPYGETYFKYPTGRFSDGRLISDFIAEHAKLPLIPPYLQPRDYDKVYCGANFASAGAGVLPETFQGAAVYKRGGRKFGFLNLGDLGCLPGLRISKPQNGSGCLEEASILAKLHNEALQNVLNKMKNHLKGFKYSLYDFNTFLRQILNHPSRYGFKEGEKACCGSGRYNGIFSCGGKRGVKEFELCKNPNEFIFWDSYHLTESVYKKMARQMWYGPSKGPYNLTQFFQCL
ncbi:GDSL esterase lipase 5 [Olea europaea subsp. europaea]|uniref:GDSL esterase lipase 5 n=1 Tax=Olea europaea subsp. europaea TaxID=158383 RepID=A0A8S0RR10_OLEEU|nr:GDSL esterase lipase 5 [Olea europaea subsp. europaea]